MTSTPPPFYPAEPPETVLQYWEFQFWPKRWTRLGSGDGFSGAVLWKGEADDLPPVVMRRYPASESRVDGNPIVFRHERIRTARLNGIDFVARPEETNTTGIWWCHRDGHMWEVSEYLKGEPIEPAKLREVHTLQIGRALGRLHKVWRDAGPVSFGLSQGVEKRRRMLAAGVPAESDVHPDLKRSCGLLEMFLRRTPRGSLELPAIRLPIQTVVADSRLEHFLFEGDAFSGLIDLAAMRIDSPLIDLARVLSGMGRFDTRWPAVRAGYLSTGMSLPADVETLLPRSILTGDICACLYWFDRLTTQYRHDRSIPAESTDRLSAMIERLYCHNDPTCGDEIPR